MSERRFPHLLTRPEVERITSLSRASIYRLMAEGAFPRPIRVGGRAVRWRASELADWLDSRPVTVPATAAG